MITAAIALPKAIDSPPAKSVSFQDQLKGKNAFYLTKKIKEFLKQ